MIFMFKLGRTEQFFRKIPAWFWPMGNESVPVLYACVLMHVLACVCTCAGKSSQHDFPPCFQDDKLTKDRSKGGGEIQMPPENCSAQK